MYQGRYNGGKEYHPPDLDRVLARAWGQRVEKIVVTAGSLAEAREALQFVERDERLFTTVGVHPTRCSEFEENGGAAHLGRLQDLAASAAGTGKLVAVGECGLDYDRLNFCPKETQKTWFAAHFELARATGLPMFLHLRNAADDFVEILEAHRQDFAAGVVHSFDSGRDVLERLLAFPNLYIGINGCSLRTEENLGVAAAVPADRLLIETDAPWCEIRPSHAGSAHVRTKFPAKDRKKFVEGTLVKGRNEPCNLVQVLEVLGGVRGEDPEALAAQVYSNTEKVFFPGKG